MSITFTEDYNPGFLNAPGFGQSVTNPLAPVFYDSLGVVKDLSVYQSLYAKNINAQVSIRVGKSLFTPEGLSIDVPVTCKNDVSVEGVLGTKRVEVDGREYIPTWISTQSGSFLVLAACNHGDSTTECLLR